MRKSIVLTAASAAVAVGAWQHFGSTEYPVQPLGLPAHLLIAEARSEAVAGALSRVDYQAPVPAREQQLQKLAAGTASNPHDILVIGGGATGTGCAVDAVTRCH